MRRLLRRRGAVSAGGGGPSPITDIAFQEDADDAVAGRLAGDLAISIAGGFQAHPTLGNTTDWTLVDIELRNNTAVSAAYATLTGTSVASPSWGGAYADGHSFGTLMMRNAAWEDFAFLDDFTDEPSLPALTGSGVEDRYIVGLTVLGGIAALPAFSGDTEYMVDTGASPRRRLGMIDAAGASYAGEALSTLSISAHWIAFTIGVTAVS